MVPYNDRRVEREEVGEWTGDRIVIDNYGTRWKIVTTLPYRTTGDNQALLIGNEIREK